eukprot:gb/GECG01009969.1/.p1 GENE.gb/GECG01009969.1/~~gb/GECG01009969.1/.p1  ORF type:complete len:1088 (+),score=164.97 gb/GECG01009969.1/:1-3264(+)
MEQQQSGDVLDDLQEAIHEAPEEHFDAVEWVNKAFRQIQGDANKRQEDAQQQVSSLVVRMQLLAQELDQDMESIMDNMVETLPTAASSLDTINLRLQSLQGRFEELSDASTMLSSPQDGHHHQQQQQQQQHDYAHELKCLHNLKQRVMGSRDLLQHAVTWERHIRDMEDVFASEDLQRMAAYLQVLTSATKTLGPLVEHLPLSPNMRNNNMASGQGILEFAQQRFEESIEPVLHNALTSEDEEALKSLVKAFIQLKRLPNLIQHIAKNQGAVVSRQLMNILASSSDGSLKERNVQLTSMRSGLSKSEREEWNKAGLPSVDEIMQSLAAGQEGDALHFSEGPQLYALEPLELAWLGNCGQWLVPSPLKAACFFRRLFMESGVLNENHHYYPLSEQRVLESSGGNASLLAILLTLYESLDPDFESVVSQLPQWVETHLKGGAIVPVNDLLTDDALGGFERTLWDSLICHSSFENEVPSAKTEKMQKMLQASDRRQSCFDVTPLNQISTLAFSLSASAVLGSLYLLHGDKEGSQGDILHDETLRMVSTAAALPMTILHRIYERESYIAGEIGMLLQILDHDVKDVLKGRFKPERMERTFAKVLSRIGTLSSHSGATSVEKICTGIVDEYCARLQSDAHEVAHQANLHNASVQSAGTSNHTGNEEKDDDDDDWLGSSDEEDSVPDMRSRKNTDDVEGQETESTWNRVIEQLFSYVDAHSKVYLLSQNLSRQLQLYCQELLEQDSFQFRVTQETGLQYHAVRHLLQELFRAKTDSEKQVLLEKTKDFTMCIGHAVWIEGHPDEFAGLKSRVRDIAMFSNELRVSSELPPTFRSILNSLYDAYVVPAQQICKHAVAPSKTVMESSSVQPSDYVVHLGEYFMNAVQTLEPSALARKIRLAEFSPQDLMQLGCDALLQAWTNNLMLGRGNESILHELVVKSRSAASIERNAYSDLERLDPNSDNNNSSLCAAFSRFLIAAMARGITACLLKCLMDTTWNSAFKAKQLKSDLEYFINILSTLRVEPDELLHEAISFLGGETSCSEDRPPSTLRAQLERVCSQAVAARDGDGESNKSFGELKRICKDILHLSLRQLS